MQKHLNNCKHTKKNRHFLIFLGLFLINIHFIDNSYFKSNIVKDLPTKSRKLKSSKFPILLISGPYSDLMVQVLKRLAYKLGGGYIIEKDTNSYSRPEYKEIKGK